jgi:hypothetical protein
MKPLLFFPLFFLPPLITSAHGGDATGSSLSSAQPATAIETRGGAGAAITPKTPPAPRPALRRATTLTPLGGVGSK